jgi:hypothetical protein
MRGQYPGVVNRASVNIWRKDNEKRNQNVGDNTGGLYGDGAVETPLHQRQARPVAAGLTGGVIYQIQPRAFTPKARLRPRRRGCRAWRSWA